MANAPSILDQVYYCNTGKGFKLGDGVTPVDELPIIGGSGTPGTQGPPGKDGIVLAPDDPRAIQHNQQVGEVVVFYGDYAPVGTLLCDGSIVELTDYPELGAFLLNQDVVRSYVGDGIHFRLPDMRDCLLRALGGEGLNLGDKMQQLYAQENGVAIAPAMTIYVSFAIRYETSVLCAVPVAGGSKQLTLPPPDGRVYGMCNEEWVPNVE